MSQRQEEPADWWSKHRLEPGDVLHWQIAALQIWVLRQVHEWRIATRRGARDAAEEFDWAISTDQAMPDADVELQRHVFESPAAHVRLRPALADRPVVSSPRLPLFVPPGEQATLFVGSPLWVQIEVGETPRRLAELAVWRPSDTWFGRPTGDGELCYSTHTGASLDVEHLTLTTTRAVTPVTIRNLGSDALKVEKLKLPVPFLALYSTTAGRLWTQAVTMRRHQGAEMAVFDVHPGAPELARDARLLSPARTASDPGLLIRAFGGLFGTPAEETI